MHFFLFFKDVYLGDLLSYSKTGCYYDGLCLTIKAGPGQEEHGYSLCRGMWKTPVGPAV